VFRLKVNPGKKTLRKKVDSPGRRFNEANSERGKLNINRICSNARSDLVDMEGRDALGSMLIIYLIAHLSQHVKQAQRFKDFGKEVSWTGDERARSGQILQRPIYQNELVQTAVSLVSRPKGYFWHCCGSDPGYTEPGASGTEVGLTKPVGGC
jgi:hypothetical protein